jgi:G3E family GTPase
MTVTAFEATSETPAAGPEPIPVTLLTGFLGSGKTTALNHLLNCDHGLNLAVIVNEFGNISIDDKLISQQAENIIELTNGCICCNQQGDLRKALREVLNSATDIDYIIVEASGLADPSPIASSFWNGDLGESVRLDGIITLVDSLNFDANLEYAEVAFSQLVNGDLILLNKVDLVEKNIPSLIEKGIRKINASAKVLTCVNGEVDPYLLLDVKLGKIKERMHETHRHTHDSAAFDSVNFESEQPFDSEQFRKFMTEIPQNAFRGKGIINVVGDDFRRIFHLVGNRCVVTQGKAWLEHEERKSQLVFIGRRIGETSLHSQLSECLV